MSKSTGQVRIIGGTLRGRRLSFLDSPGLRPTPDRVRETVFNWLMPSLSEARCLDLFAGSGALGIEAVSRGASDLTLIDSRRDVCQQININLAQLDLASAHVICADAVNWLKKVHAVPYDIVFVDPPYELNVLAPTLALLAEKLPNDALIYWEHPVGRDFSCPPSIRISKQKTAGSVVYYLGQVERIISEPIFDFSKG